MKKIFFIIPLALVLLVSISLAGTVISNNVIEAKFMSDYQKVSTEKNSLALRTSDYVDTDINQIVINQIDSSKGISIISFDVAGTSVKRITAKPETQVVPEETIKCWHCEGGNDLDVYEATKTDCLANSDMLFYDEAEKLCQSEPETTCYLCDIKSWSLSKMWTTPAECREAKGYLIYDEAEKACRAPDKPILVDCYFCDGGYKLITSQECTDNGGHLLKEECEEKPIACYQCSDEGTHTIEAKNENDCYQLAGFIDDKQAKEFCDKKPLQCFTCDKPIDVKTSQECLDNRGLFDKELLLC